MPAATESRRVLGEYVLTGTLEALTPLAVGSGEPGAYTDQGCARDGLGRIMIPGSALAGVLRDDAAVWGDEAAASVLFVEDAVFNGSTELIELRDGVAIDRRSGAAAHGVLYTREVVSRGSTFGLELRLEVVDAGPGRLRQPDARARLVELANDLAAGRELGARTSSGLGRIRLKDAALEWRGTGSRDSLLSLLAGARRPEEITLTPGPRPGRLRVTVPWSARSPLLVSVAFNGLVDRVPLMSGAGSDTTRSKPHLVIPGTSWKGVLRSRAEWIVRSLLGRDAPKDILAQFAQDLGPVARLFGRPPQARRGSTRHDGSRGAISVAETYSTEPIKAWGDLERALATRPAAGADATARLQPRVRAVEKLSTSHLRINDHVAISRWTGGADDGKLFATVAPGRELTWDPLVLDLDLSRLGSRAEARSAVMLLAYVLRDLAEGWVGVGHGSTRGYGEIGAAPGSILFEFPDGWEPRRFTLAELFDPEGQDDQGWRRDLLTAWNREVDALIKQGAAPEVTP